MPVVKPTLREKKRYLLFRVDCEAQPSAEEVKRAAYGAVLSFLGEHGASLANPKFIGFDPEERLGVLKCAHSELGKVKAALALCSSVGGRRAALRTSRASGTIKTLGEGFRRVKRRK